jgi:hypothetical protein
MDDFHHRGMVDLSDWAHPLYAPYWRIRVEVRNKALSRNFIDRLKNLN